MHIFFGAVRHGAMDGEVGRESAMTERESRGEGDGGGVGEKMRERKMSVLHVSSSQWTGNHQNFLDQVQLRRTQAKGVKIERCW